MILSILKGVAGAFSFVNKIFDFFKNRKERKRRDELLKRRTQDRAETRAKLTQVDAHKAAKEALDNPDIDSNTW